MLWLAIGFVDPWTGEPRNTIRLSAVKMSFTPSDFLAGWNRYARFSAESEHAAGVWFDSAISQRYCDLRRGKRNRRRAENIREAHAKPLPAMRNAHHLPECVSGVRVPAGDLPAR